MRQRHYEAAREKLERAAEFEGRDVRQMRFGGSNRQPSLACDG
jgi:hypothetical protein